MSLKEDVIDYWQSFNNPYINRMLMSYEFMETKQQMLEFPESYYDDLTVFFDKTYKSAPTDEYVQIVINVVQHLTTDLLMYFMQQLSKHNEAFFSRFYEVISQTGEEYQRLYMRCICFEKCQIVAKAFNSQRLDALEDVLKQIMDE